MQRTLVLFAVFLSSAAVVAQDGTVFTEDQFLSAVGDNHPAALALRRDLGRAEADLKRARLLGNPILDVLREQPDDVPRETVWGLAWTPPLDGRRGSSIERSEARLEAEKADLESRFDFLRLEVRGTYAAWAAARARVEILSRHARRLESLAERMRQRADSGEESALDARRLEMAFETSSAAHSEASAVETRARAAAMAWLLAEDGEGSVEPLTIQPELSGLPAPPAEVDAALRPDLAAAAFRVEEAEAGLRLSKRGIEAPEILLGWKTIEGPMTDFAGPVFGLSWSLPVFDRRQPDRLAAETDLAVARAESQWISQRAQIGLGAARDAYAELWRSALSAREALDGLDEVEQAATASYEQGESTVTDLLDTLRAVVEARLSALELHVVALEAHRRLEFEAGRTLTVGGLS